MSLPSIAFEKLRVLSYDLFENQSLLLTSGDFSAGTYNCMTIGWGGLGCMWNRPFVMVVVRPTRYTYEFMETYPTFSVCAFPPKYDSALNLLGTLSGRDGDKITKSGLTPSSATHIAAPVFAEADLVLECRKLYWQDLDPSHFLESRIDKQYSEKDYHRVYYGEIIAQFGSPKYL